MLENTNLEFLEAIEDLQKTEPRSEVLRVIRRALPGFKLTDNEIDILYYFAKDILLKDSEFQGDEQIARYYLKTFPFYEVFRAKSKNRTGILKVLLQEQTEKFRAALQEELYLEEEDAQSTGDLFLDNTESTDIPTTSDSEAPEDAPFLTEESEPIVEPAQTTEVTELESEPEAEQNDFSMFNKPLKIPAEAFELSDSDSQTEDSNQPQTASPDFNLPSQTPTFGAPSMGEGSRQAADSAGSILQGLGDSGLGTFENVQRVKQAKSQPNSAQTGSVEQNRQAYEQAERDRQASLRENGLRQEEKTKKPQEGNLAKRALIGSLLGLGSLLGGGLGFSILNIIT